MKEKEIANSIIDCATEVHNYLGSGWEESNYLKGLMYEMELEGLKVEKEKKMPIFYKGIKLEAGYLIDLIVEDAVIVVIKSVETLLESDSSQVITYLRHSGYKLGILINFNASRLLDEVKIYVNDFETAPASNGQQ